MGTFLLIALVGIGGFLIYRYYKRKRLETVYETENHINTMNFTFEKAVEGCVVAVTKISELDEKIGSIDEVMRNNQNVNGSWSNLLNRLLKSGFYKENNNYPESEENRKYRIFYDRFLFFIILIPLAPLVGLFIWWLSLILCVLVSIYIFMAFPPRAIRKERKIYPWHFNVQPLGSQMYILQQDFNDALEETHRLFYDLYLPCKRKADELIVDSKNRERDSYKAYQEIVKYESYMQNCTPMQRIRNLQTELQKRDIRRAIKITTVFTIATVAVTAGFVSMLNNAGKEMFTGGPQYRDKWIDTATGEKFDYDPR